MPPRGAVRLAAAGLCVLLTACGAPPPPAAAPAPRPSVSQPADRSAEPVATEQWSAAALDAQPRMAALQRSVPPGSGWQPATTGWRPAPPALPGKLTRPGAAAVSSPARLLHRVVLHLEWSGMLGTDVWEQTMRLGEERDGRVVGVVLFWGFLDDAIAGEDYRVHLRRDGAAWHVERLEQRGRSLAIENLDSTPSIVHL